MAKTSNQPLPKSIDTMGEEMMTVFNDELFSRLVCHFCHRKSPKETFVVKNGTVTGEASPKKGQNYFYANFQT